MGKVLSVSRPTITSLAHARSNLSSSRHPILSRHDSISIASALQYYIRSPTPLQGQALHAHVLKAGIHPNANISIKLLILHLKCGCLSSARKVFDEMLSPTLSAYNFLIGGYVKDARTEEPLELVRKLAFSDEKPDVFTLSMVLKLSATVGSLDLAKQVHTQIVKLLYVPDDVVFAALVDSYVKNGKLGYARSVFDLMPERNLVCSTSLIVGYMNQGSYGDAEEIFGNILEKDTVVFNAMIEGYSKTLETCIQSLELYKDMWCLRFWPSVSTFVSVMGACCLLSALEFGQQIHCQIVKIALFSHVKCGSALVDMYAKCSRIEDARGVFDCMQEKNVVSWTSMIDGYGKNGKCNEALELFFEMKRSSDVKPNHATFLSALSACGHAGLVSRGKEIFESMERDYMLDPRMEHYACMVDLLGRFGSLDEAYNFIKCVPKKPDTDVWMALLAAARLHGDVELANIAANEIFELSKDGRPGAYMALSNTFATIGKWEGVREVRDLMIERGISKDAGCTWIGTNKALCDFHVG